MPADAPTAEMDAWVRQVLGFDPRSFGNGSAASTQAPGGGKSAGQPPARKGLASKPVALAPADPNSALSRTARDPRVWTQSVGPALTRQGPYKTGARIDAPWPTGPETTCKGPNGRTVSIVKGADGRVALTRDPPPITEITFSGGGGKGAALPGAIRALAESGALDKAKEIHGASVGSMTAALVAAGVTPEGFQKFSDETDFGKLIKGNDLLPIHESGDGLEALVRTCMRSGIEGQIAKFAEDAMRSGAKVDAKDLETLAAMTKKFGSDKQGPTFGDLRILSKIIPSIKEVVISGTLIAKSSGGSGKMEKVKPELIVFSADTYPKMEVARAAHASAALPGAFKPVDIELAPGEIGRFEDGGVLNNAPSSDTLGTDRAIDPVPETRKLTFVFEDAASSQVMRGEATPERLRVGDFMSNAPNSEADYAKNRTLADRPEDVVMVPLKFQRSNGKKADYSTLTGGTLNFNIAKEDRVKLQGMTEEATEAHIKKRQMPETRSFASVEQMLACTTREDLVAMAAGEFPGAKEALEFRDAVVRAVAALEKLAAGGATASDPKAAELLKTIDRLAKGDQERVGFIGRELNRSGKLDRMLASAKSAAGKSGAKGGATPDAMPDALAAGIAVAAVVAAKAKARAILRDVLYPKMVREDPKEISGVLLAQMDTMLRDAQSAGDINRALRIGIAHFSRKMDPGGLLGHIKFVDALTRNIQPED